MKTVTVELPDSVEMSAAEIQALVLAKVDAQKGLTSLPAPADMTMLLNRLVPPDEAADLRQLIALYYAERAADLVDGQWEANGWTAETMHEWVRERLRTAHGRHVA